VAKTIKTDVLEAFSAVDLAVVDPNIRLEMKKAILEQKIRRNEDIFE